nr:hypothetical protein CPGR_01116 [Mycolicibacter nonchromogenicus]
MHFQAQHRVEAGDDVVVIEQFGDSSGHGAKSR